MKTIYEILIELRETSGRNDKATILKENASNPQFIQFIQQTLDRRKCNYFQAEIDASMVAPWLVQGESITLDEAIRLINLNICTRSISGNEAKGYLADIYAKLPTDEDRELLELMIKRDLRCGVGIKSVNKAFGADTVTYTGYMRCSGFNKKTAKNINFKVGAFSQLKSDGKFANSYALKSGPEFSSRNSTNMNDLQRYIGDEIALLGSEYPTEMVFHGELLAERDGKILPRGEGNGLFNSLEQTGEPLPSDVTVRLNVWDAIPLSEFKKGVYKIEYNTRFATLENAINACNLDSVRLTPYRMVYSFGEAVDHFRGMVSAGLEGTVLKDRGNIWKDHTSTTQLKLKVEFECELRVVEFKEGKGKNASTFGSLICESADGRLRVAVGGFTDAMRKKIYKHRTEWISKIITTRANSTIKDKRSDLWSLSHPRFIEERTDKFVADTLDQIFTQEKDAVDLMKMMSVE